MVLGHPCHLSPSPTRHRVNAYNVPAVKIGFCCFAKGTFEYQILIDFIFTLDLRQSLSKSPLTVLITDPEGMPLPTRQEGDFQMKTYAVRFPFNWGDSFRMNTADRTRGYALLVLPDVLVLEGPKGLVVGGDRRGQEGRLGPKVLWGLPVNTGNQE